MIYFVEDDNNIRKLVSYALNSNGIEAVGFELPSEFWKKMKEQLPSLILLDIMLPEEDGIAILEKLKKDEFTNKIPVIMLTAKTSEYDKVYGLDSGADDYITKPFSMMELIARIKALLRRSGFSPSETEKEEYSVSGLRISVPQHTVTVDGKPVNLALKEFELLLAIVKADGRVCTRNYLLENIWGYEFDGESRTVDVHIRKLRAKLGEDEKEEKIIETVKGIGYKLKK